MGFSMHIPTRDNTWSSFSSTSFSKVWGHLSPQKNPVFQNIFENFSPCFIMSLWVSKCIPLGSWVVKEETQEPLEQFDFIFLNKAAS